MSKNSTHMDWKMEGTHKYSAAPSSFVANNNIQEGYRVNNQLFYASIQSEKEADSIRFKSSVGTLSQQNQCVAKIHINPHFVRKNENVSNVMCKNVHINPRVLAIKTLGGLKNGENYQEPGDLLTKTAYQDNTKVVHKSPVSSSKSSSIGKKYIYHSKTKLVKVPSGSQNSEYKQSFSEIVLPMKSKPLTHSYPSINIKTPNGGTLMALSRTKLVRVPVKPRRQSLEKVPHIPLAASTPTTTTLSKSNTKFRKILFTPTTSQSKVVRKGCLKYRAGSKVNLPCNTSSKYRIDRRTIKVTKRTALKTTYKLDRRTQRPSKPVKKKYSANTRVLRSSKSENYFLFSPVRRHSFCNKVWSKPGLNSQKIMISQKRLSRIGSSPRTRHKQDSALVRIGGMLYKTSRTKLVLSQGCNDGTNIQQKTRTVVKRRKSSRGNILYVCGNKFRMDSTGKTLHRIIDSSSKLNCSINSIKSKRSTLSRVDIGGVTYKQNSPNVLIRTNTHTARNVVSNAKNKSIAVLTRKMRKNNEHCLFYRRFGKCPRLEKGRCELVHDSKYIDICKKFLQGNCDKKGCLLSHDLVPQKMPTCRYFLEGCCVRENCPYLHVKVNDKAPLCRNFLLGYCAEGELCSGRHMWLCPDFDKKGVCRKGKSCRFPHPIYPKIQKNVVDKVIEPEDPKSPEQTNESHKRKRYYESESFLEEREIVSKEAHCSDLDEIKLESKLEHEILVKRPKIGDLPSFISLEPSKLN